MPIGASNPLNPALDDRPPRPPEADAVTAGGHGRALAIFAALFALLLLGMHGTVSDLFRLWAEDSGYYSFGYLIPPICIALVWRRRRSLAALPPRPSPLAIPLILGTGAVWLLAKAADLSLIHI